MHIPDGFLDAKTSIATTMLACGGLAVALRHARDPAHRRRTMSVAIAARNYGWGFSEICTLNVPSRSLLPLAGVEKGDRRFADPAWGSNPVFRMLQQSYLASAEALDRIVTAMGDGRGDTRAEQARFAANIVTSAAAPANFLMSNPAAIKRAFDTGGTSIVRGFRHFVHDVRHNGGMPSMV